MISMNVSDAIDPSKRSSKGCCKFIFAVSCGRVAVIDQKEVVERRAQPWIVDRVFVEWLSATSIPAPEKRVFCAGRRFTSPLRWLQAPDAEFEGDHDRGNGNNLPTNSVVPISVLPLRWDGCRIRFGIFIFIQYTYDGSRTPMTVPQHPALSTNLPYGAPVPNRNPVSPCHISKLDRMR